MSSTRSETTATAPQPVVRPLGAVETLAPEAGVSAGLGWMPLLALLAAIGLLLVSASDQVAKRGLGDGQVLYWAGLLLMIAPIVVRQCAPSAARTERVLLVLVLGTALYLVKVISNAYAFTFPDEFAQTYNVEEILRTHHLFAPNPLVDITPLYPGLDSVGAAVSSLTGLSIFQAGIAVAGFCRLLLMLGLFVWLEQLTSSARLAAWGATLYAANPNYLDYSADFGYETLALPLAVLALFAATRRGADQTRIERRCWTVLAALAILAVVVTHHVTSYALTVTLIGAVLVSVIVRRRGRVGPIETPWDLALLAVCAVLAWLALVAWPTVVYLQQVFGPAMTQVLGMLRGLAPGRLPFQGGSGLTSPLWQQLVAFASVLLIAIGLAYGLWRLRRQSLRLPFGWLLALAAAAYIPIQALRLSPAAWETANRSSEFLFIGAGMVLAVAAATVVRSTRTTALVATAGVVIVLGGIIAGQPYVLEIPPPYLVEAANSASVEPEGVTDARWTLGALGPGNIVATDPTNAQLLTAYGEQFTYSGQAHGIQGTLLAGVVDDSVRGVLQTMQVRYIVVDRRTRILDHSVGFYAPGGSGPLAPVGDLFDPAVYAKFDNQPWASRIADSGNIVIYDVQGLTGESAR